jgi:hypothetical protein
MSPSEVVEGTMQKFVFDFLDKFGASFTIVAVILILTWKVLPELTKVLIDKYRAETDLVRETQKVVISFPSVFSEMKTAIIAELQKQHTSIKEHIGADTNKRIENKVDAIHREISHSEAEIEVPPTRHSRSGNTGS